MITSSPDLRKFIYCLFAHIDTYGNVEDCDTKQRMNIVMDILDANRIPKVHDTEDSLSAYSDDQYLMPEFMQLTTSTDCAIYDKKLDLISNLERDRIEKVEVPLRLICTAINALPTPAERVDFIEDLEDYIVSALQANYSEENPKLHEALHIYYQLEKEENDV